MAYPMSRALCRSLKGRFYSVQAARKPESTSSGAETTSSRVNGINVVTVENNSPLSRVMFVAKAGSRYEDPTNLGVTHVIRHTTWLTNEQSSSYKVFKELEMLGAGYSALTTRDYAFVSVSCTRNNLADVFGLVAPTVTRNMFDPWDWRDFKGGAPKVEFDVASLKDQPNVELVEQLHAAAYRETLGNSLYCPQSFIGSHSTEQALAFIQAHYRPDRLAVVATGVESEEVTNLVQQMRFQAVEGAKPNENKANYIGGEKRVARPDLNITYAAVATEGPSLASKDLLSAAVLQQIMGLGPRVKYSESMIGSKLAKAVQKVTNTPFMINGLNANYTDSGLFGFTVAAQPTEMEKVLRSAFAEFASLTKSGVTAEEVTRGKNQLKANIAMGMESGDTFLTNLAEQAIGSEKISSINDITKMVDAIQTSDVVTVAKKLVNGKPSMASIGNLANVPYLDQLLK